MNLAEMTVEIRIELQEAVESVFLDTEIARGVQKSVSIMSRLIPKRVILETTIVRKVIDEALTIATNTGTLAYKPIRRGSLTITGEVLDTDYRVNYLTGVITEIGALLADGAYVANYELDPLMLDISTLLPEENYIKVEKVEYPAGDDPPTLLVPEIFGEFLLVKGKGVSLTENDHLRITYLKPWTAPVTGTDGDYPEHLDNAVIIGSVGQVLIFKAEKYVQLAVTELALVSAAAASMATPLTAIDTALDKVTTHVAEADTALAKVVTYLEDSGDDSAKTVLSNITDDAAALRTAIETALDAAATYITNATTPPSAHDYLVDGDDYILTVNDAERVAEKYAEYARTSIQMFTALSTEASLRLDNIRTYIEEAAGWMRMGDSFMAEAGQRLGMAIAFVNEAVQRVAEVNAWAVQADRYTVTSGEYLGIAGRYLASGQAKINEFLISLGHKPEFNTSHSSSGQFA